MAQPDGRTDGLMDGRALRGAEVINGRRDGFYFIFSVGVDEAVCR